MDRRNQMREALRLAELAANQDEVPVGARILRGELLLGEGFNQNIQSMDPTAHAEIGALRDACRYFGNYRLPEATLYVTLEPCLMCFSALVHARIQTLVYGASDPKAGFSLFLDERALQRFNHRIEILPHVLAEEAAQQIRRFFEAKRRRGKRKWLKQE